MIDIKLENEIRSKVLPVAKDIANDNLGLAEVKLIKHLRSVLKRNSTKPNRSDKKAEKDYVLVKFICFNFDDFAKKEFPGIEKPSRKVKISADNKILLACCRNPELMNILLFELLNYLLWNEPYYYEQQQLLEALKDYELSGRTTVFSNSPQRH